MAGRAVRSTIIPDEDEHDQLERLARVLEGKKPARSLKVTSAGKELTLPTSALEVLRRAAIELAHGNGVTVLPVAAELSTEEAADLLNVSRPYVIKLIEAGELPHRRVGTHRRIPLRDVLEFKRKYQEQARAALSKLVDDAQDLGIYEK